MVGAASIAIALGVALLGQATPLPAERGRLELGRRVEWRLRPSDPALPGHGPAVAFTFEAGADGPVSILLESDSFLPRLRLESAAGTVLAETGPVGPAPGARIEREVKSGESFRVIAAAEKAGATGLFWVGVGAGRLGVRALRGMEDGSPVLHQTASTAALQSGRTALAARHLLAGARILSSENGDGGADAALERAVQLARRAGKGRLEDRALAALVDLLLFRGEYDRARQPAEERFALARRLDGTRRLAFASIALGRVFEAMDEDARARELLERGLTLGGESVQGERRAHALMALGLACLALDDATAAEAALGPAISGLREAEDEKCELRAVSGLAGLALDRLNDAARAKALYDRAGELARRQEDRGAESWVLRNLARAEAALGDRDAALSHAERAIAIDREESDRESECWDLTVLGWLRFESGDVAASMQAYREAASKARDAGAPDAEAEALDGLLSIDEAWPDPGKMLVSALRLLDLQRDLEDRSGEAEALMRVSEAHADTDAFSSREFAGWAAAIFAEVGDAEKEAWARTALGSAEFALGSHASARRSYEKAVELFRRIGDPESEAYAGVSLGSELLELGDLAALTGVACRACDLAPAVGDASLEGTAWALLAFALMESGELIPAHDAAEKAVKLLAGSDDREAAAMARAALGQAHARIHNYEEAVVRLEEALEMSDPEPYAAWRGGAARSLLAIYSRMEDHEAAHRAVDRWTPPPRRADPRRAPIAGLVWVGHFFRAIGLSEPARYDYLWALERYREADDAPGQARIVARLASLAIGSGDLVRAPGYLDEASSLFRRLGARQGEAWVLAQRARVDRLRGRADAARDAATAALAAFRELGDATGERWVRATFDGLDAPAER